MTDKQVKYLFYYPKRKKEYENEIAVTFLSQRKIKESRYRRLREP